MLVNWRKSKPWIFLLVTLVICLAGAMMLGGCRRGTETDPVVSDPDENGDNGEPDENGDPAEPDEPVVSPPSGRGNRPGHYEALAVEADNWIYYTHFPYSEVRKVRTDGTQAGTLSGDSNAGSLNQAGEWVFYAADAGVVQVRTDGSDREVKFARPSGYLLRYLSYVDGFFYVAVLQEGLPNQGILRIPFDGSTPLWISSDAPAGGMCVADGFIYYSTGMDGTIFRMGVDGSSREAVTTGFHPIVDGPYLYYASETTIKRRHLLTGDEMGLTVDLYGNSFQVSGGDIYYTHAGDDLKLHRANWGGGTEVAVSDPVWKAFLYNQVVLFQNHNDWKIYRVPPGATTGTLLP